MSSTDAEVLRGMFCNARGHFAGCDGKTAVADILVSSFLIRQNTLNELSSYGHIYWENAIYQYLFIEKFKKNKIKKAHII